MTDKDEKLIEEVVSVFLAKKNADDVESYLTRGRLLQQLSLEQLEEEFRRAVRMWAADHKAHRYLDEVIAEYDLRDTEPPSLHEMPEWATIEGAVERAAAAMSSDCMEEIGSEMIAEYRRVKEGEH